jgi:hypothetical protein
MVEINADRVLLPRKQLPTLSVVGRLLCDANLNIRCCCVSLNIKPIGSCVFGRYVHSSLVGCLLNTVPMGVLRD